MTASHVDADEYLAKLKDCKHAVIKAAIFWAKKAGSRLLMMLAILECNETLIKSILHHGSDEYEFEQEAFAASIASSPDQGMARRSYAMVELATLSAESVCKRKYSKFLHDDHVWNNLVSPHNRNAELRCYGFRLISSAEGHLEETLIKEGRCFPAKGFLANSSVCFSH